MTDPSMPKDSHGEAAEPTARRSARAPLRVTSRSDGLVPLTRAPSYAATTWGPYYEALHPPRLVHFYVNWKVVPEWEKYASELWRRRQELRGAYEAAHGSDPALWPSQHPGIVVGANAACLRCNWLHPGDRHRHDVAYEQHWHLARRHETSNGVFHGCG